MDTQSDLRDLAVGLEAVSIQNAEGTASNTIADSVEQQKSPFLRLPGEILNMIFKYALTTNTGIVRCRTLEQRSPTTKKMVVYHGLRDYTLSSEIPFEFNQLKYVNKQLYEQTAGLEIRFNKVLFPKQMLPLSLPYFAQQFITPMTPAHRDWIKALVFKGLSTPSYSQYFMGTLLTRVSHDITMVVKFLHAHSFGGELHVHYITPRFEANLDPREMIFIGLHLIAVFRQREVDAAVLLPPDKALRFSEVAPKWQKRVRSDPVVGTKTLPELLNALPKFKIVPAHADDVKEQTDAMADTICKREFGHALSFASDDEKELVRRQMKMALHLMENGL